MNRYIEDCINEIEKMKEEGRFDPAKIDNEIAKMMSRQGFWTLLQA